MTISDYVNKISWLSGDVFFRSGVRRSVLFLSTVALHAAEGFFCSGVNRSVPFYFCLSTAVILFCAAVSTACVWLLLTLISSCFDGSSMQRFRRLIHAASATAHRSGFHRLFMQRFPPVGLSGFYRFVLSKRMHTCSMCNEIIAMRDTFRCSLVDGWWLMTADWWIQTHDHEHYNDHDPSSSPLLP